MPLSQIAFDSLTSTIGFLLILSFLVIIHELGHLLTALWFKIGVEEFGVGYPPRAKTLFTWRNIPFTLNWLPFGGFVKMVGEDGPETDSIKTSSKSAPFYTKPKRARLVVLLAGVFINFVFGILAFSIVYTVMGFPRLIDNRLIDQVIEGSPAASAGILASDSVKSAKIADQAPVTFQTTTEVVDFVNAHLGETVTLYIDRAGQEQSFDVYLRKKEERPADQGAIGIGFAAPDVIFDFYPWWQMPFRATYVGFQESIALSLTILSSFGQMVGGLIFRAEIPKDVAGPVGIVHQATKVGLFQSGWETVLKFAGMLSVNLAILNLLPIPALDGGRAFFVMLESVIGKKLRERIESKVNLAGFAFLLGLIILISVKDVWSIVADVMKYFQG